MQPIKIYYHLTPQPFWDEFYTKKIELMKQVGLWDAASEIVFCCHYDPTSVDQIRSYVGEDSRVRYTFSPDSIRPFGEQYTNRILKKETDSNSDSFYIFRLHNKGLNHYNTVNWPSNKIISDEMDHHYIVRWRECVNKLDEGYDAVGTNWVRQPWPHFKGTFWWVKSEYIRQLTMLKAPHENNMVQQIPGGGWTVHDAESWIGTANPRAYDILRETDEIGDHPDL